MEVKVRKVTDWTEVLNAARFTVHMNDIDKAPSLSFRNELLTAEHSPVRTLIFEITIKGVPSFVSQHISRHDAFAMHTVREGSSDTHFVATQRTDRTGIDRKKMPQDAPVDHRIFLNAQDLITISRRRLCSCASPETRQVWNMVRDAVREIDPQMADHMVRECVYRGFCTEKRRSCGYDKTEQYEKELREYRELI